MQDANSGRKTGRTSFLLAMKNGNSYMVAREIVRDPQQWCFRGCAADHGRTSYLDVLFHERKHCSSYRNRWAAMSVASAMI
ncbi:hypothetical protein [Mesorhizobium sp. L-8-10]|uniref:hypothetical protein n=1 Tax=Mesorhizobium sp. L-8-10 TaxID=2744523 RepID=UPI0019293485|nr:hypothetical protein [Mesorhizobium sp. L-8-10]